MTIITISRGAFKWGEELTECLSKHLGYRTINRETLMLGAERYGIPQERLVQELEQPAGLSEKVGMNIDRVYYLSFIQAALCEEAISDNIIYHGYGGHLLLRGVSHVIKVKLLVDTEQRLAFVQERDKLSREEALAHITHRDEQRRKWIKFLYNRDWDDTTPYDVVIDLQKQTIPEACERISAMTKLPQYQSTEASRRAIEMILEISRKKQEIHQKILHE